MKKLMIAFACMSLMASCKKGEVPKPVNIYLVGYEDNAQGTHIAKYWKNGEATALTRGLSNARALFMTQANNDEYVAGNEENVITYWKNGSPTSLTDLNQYTF